MRRVVFLGNCYAATLNGVYSAAVAPLHGDRSDYVNSYLSPDDENASRLLREADVIVEQVFDAKQNLVVDSSNTAAKIIQFPTVTFNSLWPFGGGGHFRNASLPHWPCGPYDYNYGDSYLNRLINEGLTPEEATKHYVDLDIVRVGHVDRMHELVMDRQRSKDELTGMQFADEMEAYFRSEYLFLNHNRLNVRLAASLTRQVFLRLGASHGVIDNIVAHWKRTPFEQPELPIHPKVAKHFGLSYGHAGQRYLYHSGERLTFEQFVYRYASFQWNDALLRGVATDFWGGGQVFEEFRRYVPDERVQAAVDDLRIGLNASNGSARGYRALGALLKRQGRPQGALAAFENSIAFSPDDGEGYEMLGHQQRELGQLKESEATFRTGIDRDPWHAGTYIALGALLGSQGRHKEAIVPLEEVVAIRPGFAGIMLETARHAVAIEDYGKANAQLRRCIELEPCNIAAKALLAEVLFKSGDIAGARALMQQVASGDANDPESLKLLLALSVKMQEGEPPARGLSRLWSSRN